MISVVSETNYASEKILRKDEFEYSHTEYDTIDLNDTMINLKNLYKLLKF